MTTRATGRTKNILLTVWLSLPFLVVGGLVAGIFIAYSKGPAMDARPVGQGRADTGGANALGEWLAGNDPNEVERIRRDLREGRLIDPFDWAHGVWIQVEKADGKPSNIWLWTGKGGPPPVRVGDMFMTADMPDARTKRFIVAELDQARLQKNFAAGRPGAGIFLSLSDTVSVRGDSLFDADGTPLSRVALDPVKAESTTPASPIVIRPGDE